MTSSIAMRIKKHGIVLSIAGLIFAGAMWLVAYTDTDVVTRDQWLFLAIVDHYQKSALTFDDIWRGYSVHRLPVYRLLFLLDAVWFHLNVLLESYLGVISLAISALYLYLRYNETSNPKTRRSHTQLSFLVLCAILFSFNQWSMYVYPLSALDSFLGNLCFIAAWYYLDRNLDKSPSSLRFELIFSTLFMLALLGFGEGRMPAVIVATLAVVGLKNLTEKKAFSLRTWRSFGIIFCACVIAVVLYFGVGTPVRDTDAGSMFWQLLREPLGDIRYILYAMEISVVSTLANAHYPEYVHYLIGLVIFLGYLAAFWLYWKERMIRKTRMPLFLMLYSLLYLGLIMLGRFRLPATQQAEPYPRYVTDLQLGIIGMAWIFYQWALPAVASKRRIGQVARSTVAVLTVCMIAAQASATLAEIKTAPYQRAAMEKYKQFLLHGTPSAEHVDPSAVFYCLYPDLCYDGIKIMKDYDLAPYDQGNSGSTK